MIRLYNFIGHLLTPWAERHLQQRCQRGKEDPLRFQEKLGRGSGQGPVDVWIHAASIGELNAARPIIAGLNEENIRVLVTTATLSSAQMAASWLPDCLHRFAPLDLPSARKRFFHQWKPQCLITIDSEIWPGWLYQAQKQNIKVMMFNARLSPKSCRRWTSLRPFVGKILRHVAVTHAQDVASAKVFSLLGSKQVKVTAPLKLALLPKHAEQNGKRDRFVFLSMHPEERDVIMKLRDHIRHHQISMDIWMIPRHPDRLNEFGKLPSDILVEKQFGQVSKHLAQAKAVLVGGSFFPHGGQNPLEPLMFGVRPIVGPFMHNFTGIVTLMREQKAIIQVEDIEQAAVKLLDSYQQDQKSPDITPIIAHLRHLGNQSVADALHAVKGVLL